MAKVQWSNTSVWLSMAISRLSIVALKIGFCFRQVLLKKKHNFFY